MTLRWDQRSRSTEYTSNWLAEKGIVPKGSGGDVTYIYAQGKLQAVHTFNDSGTFTPLEAIDVEYLVIAGGGGGARGDGNGSGGGGAGGYRSSVVGETSGRGSSAEAKLSLVAGTAYTVTVGGGGAAVTSTNTVGNNGSNSVFATITSTGGGGGGYTTAGGNGGSGGGSGNNGAGGTGTANQGYDGGGSADRKSVV